MDRARRRIISPKVFSFLDEAFVIVTLTFDLVTQKSIGLFFPI
jgi:hypothetical protein